MSGRRSILAGLWMIGSILACPGRMICEVSPPQRVGRVFTGLWEISYGLTCLRRITCVLTDRKCRQRRSGSFVCSRSGPHISTSICKTWSLRSFRPLSPRSWNYCIKMCHILVFCGSHQPLKMCASHIANFCDVGSEASS